MCWPRVWHGSIATVPVRFISSHRYQSHECGVGPIGQLSFTTSQERRHMPHAQAANHCLRNTSPGPPRTAFWKPETVSTVSSAA